MTSFRPEARNNSPESAAILVDYETGLDELGQKIRHLNEVAKTSPSPKVKELQNALVDTRLAYKKVEFMFAYFSHQSAEWYINGAPLPKIDPQETADVIIKEPEGLQVLDELIFAGKPLQELDKIRKLTKTLEFKFDQVRKTELVNHLSDRQVFEATRAGLVRILTLGITGFDTPASGQAMPEAITAFEAIKKAALIYQHRIEAVEPDLAKKMVETFNGGSQFLQNGGDFDEFDRLTFLRDYLNPLYKQLLDAHLALNIETVYETSPFPQSVNYYADNIFASDFLDSDFYVNGDAGSNKPKRAELGRLLFFDPALSANNNMSCASCHQPGKAFSDGLAKSKSADGKSFVDRNAPSLVNTVYASRFFHDMRAGQLELQVNHVVVNEKEFNTNYSALMEKLSASQQYNDLFVETFGGMRGRPINAFTINTALAAYVRTLTALNSPFDRYVRGETDELSESAKRGFNLFMGKGACGTCHFAPIFNGTVPPVYQESESEVLGVPSTPDTLNPELDADPGRSRNGRPRERSPIYNHSFKTPTVRNIALTAPYMHNGVYENLEQVMDFYNRGGGIGLGLDVPNQTLPPDPLGLTNQEITDMISFMEALTDTSGITAKPKSLPVIPGAADRVIGGTY